MSKMTRIIFPVRRESLDTLADEPNEDKCKGCKLKTNKEIFEEYCAIGMCMKSEYNLEDEKGQ